MKTALLGLDVGTTSTKAVVFNLRGEELARASSPAYRNSTPHPGWIEQDPEQIWMAVVTVLKAVMSQINADVRIKALSIAAQSGSTLPVDNQGNPVYPLITWMDGRTEDLITGWRKTDIQTQVKQISGWSLYPGLCLPTIAWLRQKDAQTFTTASHFFSVNDFIVQRLTGERITNPSNGGGMQLINVHTGQWSRVLCDIAGITPSQLSKIQPSGSIINEILPEVCSITGLTQGAVLVNGGHDQGCTALGLGIIDPGKLLLACGTAWVFTGVRTTHDLNNVPPILDLNFHTVPQRYTISQSLGGLGASLEWWVKQAWGAFNGEPSRQERYAALNAEVNQSRPKGRLYFVPLTGGNDDPATTKPGGFVGLQLAHNRADMARAIMESAAFELRLALEAVIKAGIPVEALWMVGGAAHSPHWPVILANGTHIPIHLPQYDHWPALGAAVLAGVGTGLFENFDQAQARIKKPHQSVMPDPGLASSYYDYFEGYKRVCCSVRQQVKQSDIPADG